jgi:class 3 adenylate cyclase
MSAPAAATATILFTDLVGFTEYNDACGDAAAVAVLDRQTDIARDAVEAATGRVVKELGDGLMLWFADTGNGLRAATEMLAAVERARATDEFPLALRMGMHCGDVVERGDDFVGQTVNVAARIADLAGPGELLASEDVVGAAGIAPTAFRPVGPTRVKGVATPVWLYRLVG